MNCVKLFFLSILCISLSVAAQQQYRVQWENVNKKSVAIERKAVRDSYLLASVTALGYAQGIHSLIVFFTAEAPEQLISPLCEPCKEKSRFEIEGRKKMSFLESFAANVADFRVFAKNLFFTPQGWGSIGKLGVYYVGQLSALFFMAKFADDLTHPDTLRWYISEYAPYKATTNVMKEAIEELLGDSLDTCQVNYNNQLLLDSLNRIARYGESVSAYMLYKSRHLDVLERPVAEGAARYVFNYHNDWLAIISPLCELHSSHYNEIRQLIISYENEMAGQLRYFSAIEGETKAQRRAVFNRGENYR